MPGLDPANYRLPTIEMGEGSGPAIVLLHGFAGAAISWRLVQPSLAAARSTMAFDLPGHAGAADYPGFGPPKVAARAVLSELGHRGMGPVHLVGHSMGGAVAALAALFSPERVASLTLLAPGGFGPEIGTAAMRGIVEGDEDEAVEALVSMGAGGWRPDPSVLALYRHIRSIQSPTALAAMFALMFRGDTQGVLPLDAIAALGIPLRLVWGTEDGVTPFRQSTAVPAAFALTALEGVGHMLMEEAPDRVVAEILAAIDAAEAVSPRVG